MKLCNRITKCRTDGKKLNMWTSIVKKLMLNSKEHFGKLRLIYDGRSNSVGLHGFDPKPAKICWIWQGFTRSFWLPLSPEVKATFGIWTKAKEKVWMNHAYHNGQVSHNSNYHDGFPFSLFLCSFCEKCFSISDC